MPSRDEMIDLVRAHAAIPDDPLDAAIWIHRDDPVNAWLVEVLPRLSDDRDAARPMHFNPGRVFAYPLHLIASNEADLRRAIARDPAFAALVAAGEVLYGDVLGRSLQELAAQVRDGGLRAG